MKLRRILALIGIILLLALYGSTMVFALMDSPLSKGLLMGAVFATIAVPVLLYAILLVAKNVRGKGVDPEISSHADETASSYDPEGADGKRASVPEDKTADHSAAPREDK